MNAGKSTALLQAQHNYGERGMETFLLTAKVDLRAGVGKIRSRIGIEKNASTFDADDDLFELVAKADQGKKIACVLVDEAQFLNKEQVLQLSKVVDFQNIPVLAFGLRTDFLSVPFEGSQYLLAWADEIKEIKTICHCGKKATMNARINLNGKMETVGDQIEIGGNERYVSLCRKCFFSKNTGIKAAKSEALE